MQQSNSIESIVLRPVVPIEAHQLNEPRRVIHDACQRIASHAGNIAAGLAVAAEISPLTNEGVRLGALTALQGVTNNAYASTAGYAGLTFAIEAAGAVSAAYLIHQPIGTKALAKADALLGKAKLGSNSVARDALTSFVLGSAVATIGAHRRNPDRSLAEDVRYGLKSAAGVTVMTAPIGFALAEGASAAGIEKIGTGFFALYGALAVGSLAKRVWRRYSYTGRHRSDP